MFVPTKNSIKLLIWFFIFTMVVSFSVSETSYGQTQKRRRPKTSSSSPTTSTPPSESDGTPSDLDLSLSQPGVEDSPANPGTPPPSSNSTSGSGSTPTTSGASPTTSSGNINDVINALDYPELQVVPRATERLKMEAKDEASSWYLTHWTIELSGLTTLTTALTAKGQYRSDLTTADKNTADTTVTVAQAVGGGWLLAGILIGLQKPYKAALDRNSKLAGKDERTVLMRERLAEEGLEKPARLMRPLKWAAVLSNFGLSAMLGIPLTDQGRIMAGLSAVIAFLPLMYEDRSIDVYDKHIEYKKKIYRPMSAIDIYSDPNNKLTPIAKLAWEF